MPTNGDGITSPDEAYQGDAVALLKEAKVTLLDDTEDGSRGSGLMHHKFVILDQAIVITGSANFTSSGMHGDADATKSRGNVNYLLRLGSTELAKFSFRVRTTLERWPRGSGKQPIWTWQELSSTQKEKLETVRWRCCSLPIPNMIPTMD